MLDYRIFILSPQGKIIRSHEFKGPDDQFALAEAKKYSGETAIEIWQQSRLIARIDGGRETATG
jgi:hypothetical protein